MTAILSPDPERFPVDALAPRLKETLKTNVTAILQAEPGAGKSTRVPLWLLDQPWLSDRKILLLEPRRLAASLIAGRLAETLGQPVGQTVGIRMRQDTRVGKDTRIEVITEGVLTRMIQDDPELTGVALIIFDEFHERNLDADFGLALALDVQSGLRDDIRLLVMSATLDVDASSAYLGDAPAISSPGRSFPVTTTYVEFQSNRPLAERCADGVMRALRETDEGDVLAFLPGEGEISRCADLLGPRLPATVQLHPLYGRLSLKDQQAALAPASGGSRKVVLATNLAESSVTVQGVRIVVDAGHEKVLRVDPGSGMSRLHTQWISRASADQRRGRAGREAPGSCYRLWTEPFHGRMRPFSEPEIMDADLTPIVLEMANWGAAEPSDLNWLTPPPMQAWAAAVELLRRLGALDGQNRITGIGKAMSRLPVHPRLARIIISAETAADKMLACELAALLSERDVLGHLTGDCDLRRRLDALRKETGGGSGVNRCGRLARSLQNRVGANGRRTTAEAAGRLLAFGFPDRIAAKREGSSNRYRLANGKGCNLEEADPLAGEPFLVVPEVTGGQTDAIIRLATPVAVADLERIFEADLVKSETVTWDDRAGRVVATVSTMVGDVALRSGPLADPPSDLVARALMEGIRERGLAMFNWSKKATALRTRVAFVAVHAPGDWPDVSDDALSETLETWLGPHLTGCTKAADIAKVDLYNALLGLLSWDQRQALDRLAPESIKAPSGRTVKVDYSDPQKPAIRAQIQWMFGLATTPSVCNGRVTLTVHLTSPAQRPVQVTDDLEGFWKGSYAFVRKELRGRYPKHYWPENPLEAEPTNRTKNRMH